MKLCKILGTLGAKVIREDFNIETCFFYNLPGNYFYNNRNSEIPASQVAKFSNIYSKKQGNYSGSKWGAPITIFNTGYGGYYYFNFHYEENGHTFIMGPKGSGKSSLAHFLLLQSIKHDPRIIYFDLEGRSKNFIKILSGEIIEVSENQDSLIQVDIFNIANYENSVSLMAEFLLKICAKEDEHRYNNKEYIKKFEACVTKLQQEKSHDAKKKYFDNFINGFEDLTIKSNYEAFFKDPFFPKFFKQDLNSVGKHKYLSFNFSLLLKNRKLLNAILTAYLTKIADNFHGEKVILVVNHGHNIFLAHGFRNRVRHWLERLTKKNVMVLFTRENSVDDTTNDAMQYILEYFATKIYLSNKMISKSFKHNFSLSDQEFNYIKSYDKSRHKILLQHGTQSIFTSFDLKSMPEMLEYTK